MAKSKALERIRKQKEEQEKREGNKAPKATPAETETPVTETPKTTGRRRRSGTPKATPAETPVTETPKTTGRRRRSGSTKTVTETPVTETPVTETPVTETPVTETPKRKRRTNKSPVEVVNENEPIVSPNLLVLALVTNIVKDNETPVVNIVTDTLTLDIAPDANKSYVLGVLDSLQQMILLDPTTELSLSNNNMNVYLTSPTEAVLVKETPQKDINVPKTKTKQKKNNTEAIYLDTPQKEVREQIGTSNYYVSNHGKIFNGDRQLTPLKMGKYVVIDLTIDSIRTRYKVHELLADCFNDRRAKDFCKVNNIELD